MKSLARLAVAVADLAEAEGRLARKGVLVLAIAVMVFFGSAFLLTLGAVVLSLAMFMALREVLHPAAAMLVASLILIAAGAFLGLVAAVFVREQWKVL